MANSSLLGHFDSQSYQIVDKSTGEVVNLGNGFIAYSFTKEEKAYRNSLIKEYGRFVWIIINEGSPLLKILPQSLTKLIYLATYMAYDNALCFDKYPRDRGKRKRQFLTKWDLWQELNIPRSSFTAFFNEVTSYGLLYEQEDIFYLSKEVFHKGVISKTLFNSPQARVSRIFCETARSLYNSTKSSQHHMLGFLFRLIPYANCKFNVLTNNIKAEEPKEIKPLSLREVARKVGYEPHNCKRLVNRLSSFTFTTKSGRDSHAVIQLKIPKAKNWNRTYLMIHPCLLYGGSVIEEVSSFQIELTKPKELKKDKEKKNDA